MLRLERIGPVAVAAAALLLSWSTAPASHAASGSLYSGPGARPGPDILYAPPADAPQLDNAPGGIWRAPPILVSGASAYRDGEFLYQDFLYDDHGAKQMRDQNDMRQAPGGQSADGDIFALPNGTYSYPTNPAYANNAADLVELRIKPLATATAFRITLNTLKDPALVATTIAIGGTPGVAVPWPHGANVRAPGDLFLTIHGTSADLLNAVGAAVGSAPPTVSVDMLRRQLTVLLPHADFDPTGKVVRLAAGVGLWDGAAGRYLLPQANADATHPGGSGRAANPAAFFNLAFRYREPLPVATNSLNDPGWWRDQAQGHALAAGDISQFFADVDFSKLAAGVNDDMPDRTGGVPQTGAMDRILASHFETEQGADYSVACGTSTACKGELRGRLQPYAIYVPRRPMPAGGWGLTLLLHSLSASYNQFEGSRNQSQFGERAPGSIVITPEGRGTDGWYYDQAGADTFEVWADVAARYQLNPAYTDIAGYSMGGYGTYKLASQFPDLFAKAQPTVGPPGLGIWLPPADPEPGGAQSNTNRMLASLRNIPFLIWNASSDELVPTPGAIAQASTFGTLGYRYVFDLFAPAEHLTLAINDQYQPAADFLGNDTVDRNPAHVTYVYNPTMDFPADGTTAGHAYWVSGLTLRGSGGSAPLGQIDARSEGFGVGDPTPSGVSMGGGLLTGGSLPLPALAYSSATQTWGPTPVTPVADRLDLTASNLATATIDAARARLSCDAQLNVTTDGPLALTMTDCGGVTGSRGSGAARACTSKRTLHLRLPRNSSRQRLLSATVSLNGHRIRTLRGRALRSRRISLRGLGAGVVRVRLRLLVTSGGRRHVITETRVYRTCKRRARAKRRTQAGRRTI